MIALSEEEYRASLEDIEAKIRLRAIAEKEAERRVLRLVSWLVLGTLLLLFLYVVALMP